MIQRIAIVAYFNVPSEHLLEGIDGKH